VDLISLIQNGTITGRIAKDVFAEAYQSGRLPQAIVQEQGLTQIADERALTAMVRKVIDENPSVIAKYKEGKTGVMGFLVGQVMKESKGRANPQRVQELFVQEIETS
jgi:aspartyl-tRNA(Asn)/glutamyl-tRNA(Gln) amidotransferase subunit B